MHDAVLILPSKDAGLLFCVSCRSFVHPDRTKDLTCTKRHASLSFSLKDCLDPGNEKVKMVLTPKARKALFLVAQKIEGHRSAQHIRTTRRFYPCCGDEDEQIRRAPCTPSGHHVTAKFAASVLRLATIPFLNGDANNVDCVKQDLQVIVNNLMSNSAIREDYPVTGLDVQFSKKHLRSKAEFMEIFATQQKFS